MCFKYNAMEGYITEKDQNLFRRVLNGDDYVQAGEMSGFSFSTVNNIVNGKTKITLNNKSVYEQLLRLTLHHIGELHGLKGYINKQLRKTKN